MKGRIRELRHARLCGLWALRQVTVLPRDVRRYIGRYLEWEHAHCWYCLRRYPVSLRTPYENGVWRDDQPHCPRADCPMHQYCSGCHKLDEKNPPPVNPKQQGIHYSFEHDYWPRPRCEKPADHIREMLAAFDFLCSLTGQSLPSGWQPYPNTIQYWAMDLARQRKEAAHAKVRAQILREERARERERRDEARGWRMVEKGKGGRRRGK